MKLYRRWKRSGRTDEDLSLPTYDEFQPIETHEQEEMVRSYERQQAQQSTLWRRVFVFLLVCFAAFLVFSIYQQALSPWELRYHAYFMDDVDSWVIIVAVLTLSAVIFLDPQLENMNDSVAVAACLMAINGLSESTGLSGRRWIWFSLFTGILLAGFWLYYMLRLPTFRWDIIWLPFGPLSAAGICLYVDTLLVESFEEIRKLRASMYTYKRT